MFANKLQVLSEDEIKRIDGASRALLWEVGTLCHYEEAFDIFENIGCKVDRFVDGHGKNAAMIYIPDHVVNDMLAKCSPTVYLYNRETGKPVIFGGDNVSFGSVGVASYAYDIDTDTFRVVTEKDINETTKLCDVLPNLDFLLPHGTPAELPPMTADLYECKAQLLYSSKPFFFEVYSKENTIKCCDMIFEVSGGQENFVRKPFAALQITLTSPLHLRDDVCFGLIEGGKRGIGAFIESGPMSCGTGPSTLAANVALANAEILGAFILAKAVNPNVPLVYCSWARIIDMKFAACAHGGPEFSLQRVALSQLGKYYNLPTGGGCMLSDTKAIDVQYGLEKMGNALICALAGVNMMCGMGQFADENAISLESYIIDNEIAGWIKRAKRGITVNDDTLDIEIIREVGPGGDFLRNKHTYAHYANEQFIPSILDRGFLAIDKDPEKKLMRKRAKKYYQKLMQSYVGPQLSEECKQKIQAIIDADYSDKL